MPVRCNDGGHVSSQHSGDNTDIMSRRGPKCLRPLLKHGQLTVVYTGLDGQQGSLEVACLDWANPFSQDCGNRRTKLPAVRKSLLHMRQLSCGTEKPAGQASA